ncbi:MAG TPA: PAS domain S-box protein [Candidatus Krumholzibacteria bacterium]|nr:PAS domain S-box protein [Candidatus Krumholzibacteria bacterium]HPD71024.1 PAS domain S-box protein [Candidatus Krumholzibacteria bacterium]HRY39276.1 PAS domain S-box protein [Candidatus Krumholzibacteria bacterium]
MSTLARRAVILVVILGALHWVLDAVYLYTSFQSGEVVVPGESGPSLLGTLVTEIPRHSLLGRATFLAVLVITATVVVLYLGRAARRESGLLRQLESAGDLFSRHALDGRFLYASAGFQAILGADPVALRGRRGLPGWRVVNTGEFDLAWQRMAHSDQPATAAFCLRHDDGREFWFESIGRRVATAGGRGEPEVIVISRDVTERRRTEAALAASEQRLRLITENMQEILWLREGTELRYLNTAFERVFGVPREVARGGGLANWLPWLHVDDRERVRLAVGESIEHHAPLDEEFRIVRPDGQVRWLHARTVHEETGSDGRPVAVGVAADITSRRRAEDALRETAARFRSLFEAAHVGITITDLAGNLLFANPAAAELYGCGTVRDLLSHGRRHGGIRAFYRDPQDRDRFAASLQADARGRLSGIQDMQRLDGTLVKLHVSCGLSVNPESGRAELVSILEDVTERLRAEAELRRSEERYRRLVEFLPDGVLVHDGCRVIYANPACARLFGAGGRALSATSLDSLVPAESRAYLALPEGLIGNGLVRGPDDVWLRHLDGTLFPAAVTSLPLADPTGPSTLTVIKDLTRIRRFGEEIAAQQEILVALIETMPLGIVAKDLDQDLRYVVWNRYMEQELGVTKAEALGRCDSDLFSAEIAAEMRRQDHLAATSGLPQDLGEIRLVLRDRDLDVHIVKVPVRDADGQVVRIFSLVENVTRQKQLQARLQQSRKMEAVGRLAGAVGHDFNNLLQVVQGYAETILHGLDRDSGQRDDVGMVLAAVDRARELVQRLLAYSRYDVLQPDMVDLNRVVDQLVATSRGVLPASVRLVVRKADQLPKICADPQQIEQALLNLVLNARDALPGEGRIEIETAICDLGREFRATRPWARVGRYVQVTVRDNGCGIPPDAREHIYEPFYSTKGFGRGTGLGLATTYNICKQHQGYIDFESELDVGTSFHVFLPIPATVDQPESPAAGAAPVASGRGELVLLVEDDDMVRSLTRQMLERAGYKVLEARDGEDAMELFMAHAAEVELLIFDVVMPRMDGRMLYDNISELRPGVPVLFCSSYSADILESEYMLEVGGTLLSKPYRVTDLLQRVRSLLDRRATA